MWVGLSSRGCRNEAPISLLVSQGLISPLQATHTWPLHLQCQQCHVRFSLFDFDFLYCQMEETLLFLCDLITLTWVTSFYCVTHVIRGIVSPVLTGSTCPQRGENCKRMSITGGLLRILPPTDGSVPSALEIKTKWPFIPDSLKALV